jgi:large subunit ribosomal protein L19
VGKRARVRERRSAGPEELIERELLYSEPATPTPEELEQADLTAEETIDPETAAQATPDEPTPEPEPEPDAVEPEPEAQAMPD